MEHDILIDEATELLPRVSKLMHAAMACYPHMANRTFAQKRALAQLYHSSGSSLGELAQAVGLSMPAASEMIDRLVEEGLVARAVNPADRRQVIVELTATARTIGDEIRVIHRAQVQAALDRMAPEERPVFVRSLRALAEALHDSVDTLQQGKCPQYTDSR
ncbi:MAG: MarR family winged helix-turn-helix transcriptional regulator [Thermomicrobiales bacterium]